MRYDRNRFEIAKASLSIQEKIELILDKVDNNVALKERGKRFCYLYVHRIEDVNTINFILNGCDLPG